MECAIRDADRWLLIVRGDDEAHAAGALSLVGGTVERGDPADQTLESALRREVLEEVGIELTSALRFVESKTFVTDSGEWVLDVVFLAVAFSGTPRIVDAGEVAAIEWRTTEEVLGDERTPPWTAQSIRLAADMLAAEPK